MSSRKFGYGRVSSKNQNEARQLKAFKDFGIDDRYIYALIKNLVKILIGNNINYKKYIKRR